MKVVDTVYTYGISDEEVRHIAKKLKYNVKKLKLYIVCLPVFGDGLLEIYDYRQFQQTFYKKIKKDIVVVGIAPDRAGAEEIVLGLTQDLYDAACDFNVKNFFGI